MPLVWKHVASPGSYFYEDDKGAPHTLVVTPQRIKHWHDSGKKMLGAKLSIPIPKEHDPAAKPLTPAEKAAHQLMNQAGEIRDYKIEPGDKLFALCDITDKQAAAKIPQTIRFTSPWINSFMDGDGNRWDDVISHLALTARPRIHRQEPFPNFQAALSIATPAPDAIPEGGICLSRAGKFKETAKGLTPLYPGSFSEWAGAKLATAPPMEKPGEKPPAEKPKEGNKPPEGKEGEKPPEAKPGEVPMEAVVEEEMDLCDIFCDLMSIMGVEMPEGTSEENMLQNALKALMEHLKTEKAGAEMSDQPNNQPNTGKNDLPANPPVIAEQPPMYMSLEAIEKETNPLTRAMGKRALSDGERTRSQRIEKLARRMPQRERDRLVKCAEGAKLSLDTTNGTVHDPLAEMLDIMEAMPDTQAMLSGAVLQPQPEDQTGQLTEERRKAIVEEMETSANIRR